MESSKPRQPYLSDAQVLLCAPTQAWSRFSGDEVEAIDGIYHGDTRYVSALHLGIRAGNGPQSAPSNGNGNGIEWIACVSGRAGEQRTQGIPRLLDDDAADPRVRVLRDQRVTGGGFAEQILLESKLSTDVTVEIVVSFRFDFTPMSEIKDGRVFPREAVVILRGERVSSAFGSASVTAGFPGADVRVDGDRLTAVWRTVVPANGSYAVSWNMTMQDASLVVAPAHTQWPDTPVSCPEDPDLEHWVSRAWSDLGALRLTLPGSPDQFFAAGSPWFMTLFGRDALWAARLILPFRPDIALSTLRVLGGMQAEEVDPHLAAAPGKILHELRSSSLEIPAEGVVLPPLYYGSVDATLLWICLLADVWRLGGNDGAVADLMPQLRAALVWVTEYGDSNGDTFIDYFDEAGTGLQNQGWKDSGDSIQWRDGTLAEGPLALCEVQAYAYEALLAGADLIAWDNERADRDPDSGSEGIRAAEDGQGLTPTQLRARADQLRQRFHDKFWVETEEGRYPAVALDGHGRAVDSLTSNIGHLIGTGILSPKQEAEITSLLLAPSMSSGYGIRTLSTRSRGYWPLSYHAGSVWTHDTAVAMRGMAKVGLLGEARLVARQLVRAAASFAYRAPELFSGDSIEFTSRATPYPASCKPQAWAAASALACFQVLSGAE